MTTSTRTLLTLGSTLVSLAALTGCGARTSGSAAPHAAKNLYLVNSSYSNGVESDSILTFASTSTGAATPTGTLALPANFITSAVATGPTGELYVAGEIDTSTTAAGEVRIYAAGFSNSAQPTTILSGSATVNGGTFTYADEIAVNGKGQLIVVSDDATIEVFPANPTSSSAPSQYITWGTQVVNGQTNFSETNALAVDSTGAIYVMDSGLARIDIFAATATGNTAPTRTITGTSAGSFEAVYAIAIDASDNLYVANINYNTFPASQGGQDDPSRATHHASHRLIPSIHTSPAVAPSISLPTSIVVFAPTATGVAIPVRTLGGSATGLQFPAGLAVDSVGNLYCLDFYSIFTDAGPAPIMVFPAEATGNVAPTRTFTSTALPQPDFSLSAF